ncbi:MAG: hypothetical protein P4L46_13750 [Fimbriimonas sp.]|nr:hypothetical protein [Fimbriimonas sp.]
MDAIRLTVLGAGSVRCSPPVIASLANYYGERPLEITLADADEERLDLFDRFARVSFAATNASHGLKATADLYESVSEAELVVVQICENCARKFLRASRRQGIAELDDLSMIEQAAESLVAAIPQDALVLSLLESEIILPRVAYHRVSWPDELTTAERMSMPHRLLRWIRGRQDLGEFLRKFEESPLKGWLDKPESAIAVQSTPTR